MIFKLPMHRADTRPAPGLRSVRVTREENDAICADLAQTTHVVQWAASSQVLDERRLSDFSIKSEQCLHALDIVDAKCAPLTILAGTAISAIPISAPLLN